MGLNSVITTASGRGIVGEWVGGPHSAPPEGEGPMGQHPIQGNVPQNFVARLRALEARRQFIS